MIKYFEDLVDVLGSSLQSIDTSKFEQLVKVSVKAIKNGNKIVVSGLGKNVPICDKFVGTMNSAGLAAQFLHTNSAVHGDLGIVRKGDIVIVLTKSGETSESIYLTTLLEKREVEIWLISFCENSTLSERIKNSILIKLKHEGDKWDLMPNNSTTINLIVLQALAMEIINKMDVPLEQFKMNHPGGHIGRILDNE